MKEIFMVESIKILLIQPVIRNKIYRSYVIETISFKLFLVLRYKVLNCQQNDYYIIILFPNKKESVLYKCCKFDKPFIHVEYLFKIWKNENSRPGEFGKVREIFFEKIVAIPFYFENNLS